MSDRIDVVVKFTVTELVNDVVTHEYRTQRRSDQYDFAATVERVERAAQGFDEAS